MIVYQPKDEFIKKQHEILNNQQSIEEMTISGDCITEKPREIHMWKVGYGVFNPLIKECLFCIIYVDTPNDKGIYTTRLIKRQDSKTKFICSKYNNSSKKSKYLTILK